MVEAHDQEPRVRNDVQGQETGLHRRDRFAGYAGRGGANRTIKGAGMVLVSSLMKLCYNVLGGLFEPRTLDYILLL